MKLEDLSKEELETMNYDDIAYIILKNENAKMKINVLFKRVCDCLDLSEQDFIDKIANFFELLTTDKRFIMLEDGSWDLKEHHNPEMIVDDEDDETVSMDIEDEQTEEEEDQEEDIFYDTETDDDLPDDDLDDLVVIDVEDEEANN